MTRGRAQGFTLIELMVVVAVIGVLFAIAIPNFLNALDRGRQKRTMSDIRTIGVALESYAVDANIYPRNLSVGPVGSTVKPIIQPTFVKAIPEIDAWGFVLTYESDATGSEYTVVSLGKDGVLDASARGPTMDFDCDIVFGNGRFIEWPEGIQT